MKAAIHRNDGDFVLPCRGNGSRRREADVPTGVKEDLQAARWGVALAAISARQGERTALVFLHGWGGDAKYWKEHQVAASPGDYARRTRSGTEKANTEPIARIGDHAPGRGKSRRVVQESDSNAVILVGHSREGPVSARGADEATPGGRRGDVSASTAAERRCEVPGEAGAKLAAAVRHGLTGTIRAGFLRRVLPRRRIPSSRAVAREETDEEQEPEWASLSARSLSLRHREGS